MNLRQGFHLGVAATVGVVGSQLASGPDAPDRGQGYLVRFLEGLSDGEVVLFLTLAGVIVSLAVARIVSAERKPVEVEKRLEKRHEEWQQEQDRRVTALEARLDAQNQEMAVALDAFGKRLDNLFERFEGLLDNRLERLEDRLASSEREQRGLTVDLRDDLAQLQAQLSAMASRQEFFEHRLKTTSGLTYHLYQSLIGRIRETDRPSLDSLAADLRDGGQR